MDYETKHRLWGYYEAIQICKELCEQQGYDVNEICGDKILKRKRKIREIYKRENEKPERHIVHENGIDGYIELLRLPEEITTRETADEWFQYNEYMECIPSAFDVRDRDLRVGTNLLKEMEDGGLTIAFRLMYERREI